MKRIIRWLKKQGIAPGIGEFKETLGQTLWWGTLVSFVMMSGTFYYTTLRFVVPWYSLDKFTLTVVLGIGFIYLWEHKFGVKSLWAYRARQMGINGKDINPDGPVVVVSGGFDPLNGRGHLTHIQEAKKLGGKLIVILTRNDQLIVKGNKPNGTFYPDAADRIAIIRGLEAVDEVVMNIDTGLECAESLRMVKPQIFAKGGDRGPDNMPQCEIDVCKEIGCQIVYNVGDSKMTSSSELIRKAANER